MLNADLQHSVENSLAELATAAGSCGTMRSLLAITLQPGNWTSAPQLC
jgi:hypothetical protein